MLDIETLGIDRLVADSADAIVKAKKFGAVHALNKCSSPKSTPSRTMSVPSVSVL